MAIDVQRELALLEQMTIAELRAKHIELFGEPTRSGHREFLVRRIIWRMQALAEGDLCERAHQRAAELARDADLRLAAPTMHAPIATTAVDSPRPQPLRRPTSGRVSAGRTPFPPPGSMITRKYRGRTIEVRVLPDGFEYAGDTYRSLSAVARAVTGSHWNGWLFFGLMPYAKKKPRSA